MKACSPAPTSCSGRAQTGAKALMAAILYLLGEAHPGVAHTAGIYNCRNQRGGGTLSHHARGSAGDTGFPGVAHPVGSKLARALVACADALGVQRVIWAKQIIDCRAGWRDYFGTNPHWDHVHWELTVAAMTTLTFERAVEILRPHLVPATVPAPAPIPVPPPPQRRASPPEIVAVWQAAA